MVSNQTSKDAKGRYQGTMNQPAGGGDRKQHYFHRLTNPRATKGGAWPSARRPCDMPHVCIRTKAAWDRGSRAGYHLRFRSGQGVQQARDNINRAHKHHASISSCHQSIRSHEALPHLPRDQSCEIREEEEGEEEKREKEKEERKRKLPGKQKRPELTEPS